MRLGQRVKFIKDLDFADLADIKEGETGTICYMDEDNRVVHVKLDKRRAELDFWDNELWMATEDAEPNCECDLPFIFGHCIPITD